MRLHRKITALISALVMLCMCMAAPVNAQEASDAQNDVSEEYAETVKKLTSLGIYSFDGEAPDAYVTRAQFACMVTDLLGADGVGVSDISEYFTDVNSETEYSEEISEAVGLSLMNGMGDGSFRPDGTITYIQALKTVVTALGYQPVARGRGGYPWGYVSCGAELGISKGAASDYNDNLTFDMAVRMIMLAAEAPVFEYIAVTKDATYFQKDENKTVLNVYHGIEFSRGIMTDNGVTAINSESSVGKENVKIGSRILNSKDSSVKEFLGCNVEYYYREGVSTDYLLYARVYSNRNNIVVLNAKELLTDNADFTKTNITAQVNGRKQSYKILSTANLIYNGVLDKTFTSSTMKLDNGTLTLIDADMDNVYELVKAEEYADVLVSSVSDGRLIAKTSPADSDGNSTYNVIVYDEFEHAVFQDADGNTIPAESIKAGDVVSVFRSKDGKTAIRFVQGIKGTEITVKESCEENGNYYIGSGTDEYMLSASYRKMMNLSAAYPTFDLGEMYRIYLNYEGDIAAAEKIDSRTQYAYFMGIGTKSGINKDVQLKLYLDSNDCVVVNTAKKVEINQVKGEAPAKLMEEYVGLKVGGEIVPQLVKIKLNSNGELTSIETAGDKVTNEFGFDLNKFSLVYVNGYEDEESTSNLYSGTAARAVAGGYCVNDATKIFRIESRELNPSTLNEDDIEVIPYSTFAARYGTSYIRLYDANASWACGAAVVSQRISMESRYFLVDSCEYAFNKDGQTILKASGWWKGLYWTFRESREGIIASAIEAKYPDSASRVLKKGDVILLSLDHNQELDAAELLWSPQRDGGNNYSEKPESASGSTHISTSEEFIVVGAPCVVEDGRIGIYTGAEENSFWVNLLATSPNIYKYDMLEKTLVKITEEEIPVAAVLNATGDGYDIVDASTKVFLVRNRSVIYDLCVVTNINCAQ